MKKTLILFILLCCIGCQINNNTKEKITYEEASNRINQLFHYDDNKEEYEMEYYKQVKYMVNNSENEYYAFLIKSKISEYKYYVLIDIYGNNILNPISFEEVN